MVLREITEVASKTVVEGSPAALPAPRTQPRATTITRSRGPRGRSGDLLVVVAATSAAVLARPAVKALRSAMARKHPKPLRGVPPPALDRAAQPPEPPTPGS